MSKHSLYIAIVERGESGSGVSAYFPDFDGCVTAADTIREIVPAAREALALHIKGMIEDGLPIPEPTPAKGIKDAGIRVFVEAEVG